MGNKIPLNVITMFKKIRFIIFSLVFLVGIFLSQIPFAQDTTVLSGTEILKLYNQLKAIELDRTKIAKVENIVIKRDVATIHLRKGEIYLTEPVSGKVSGTVFVGEGVVGLAGRI